MDVSDVKSWQGSTKGFRALCRIFASWLKLRDFSVPRNTVDCEALFVLSAMVNSKRRDHGPRNLPTTGSGLRDRSPNSNPRGVEKDHQ